MIEFREDYNGRDNRLTQAETHQQPMTGWAGRLTKEPPARQRTGLTLKELGAALGSGAYKTIGKSVWRFTAALSEDMAKRGCQRSACMNCRLSRRAPSPNNKDLDDALFNIPSE